MWKPQRSLSRAVVAVGASLLLVGGAASVASAEDREPGQGPFPPANPTNLNDSRYDTEHGGDNAFQPIDSVSRETVNPDTGDGGSALSIDFASSFNFGEIVVDYSGSEYESFADPQSFRAPQDLDPTSNYVQVSDTRAAAPDSDEASDGYILTVEFDGFENDEEELTDARVSFDNGVIATNLPEDGSWDDSELPQGPRSVELEPGETVNLMWRDSAVGNALFAYRFDSSDSSSDEDYDGVRFTVPVDVYSGGEYRTNFTWGLTQGPAPVNSEDFDSENLAELEYAPEDENFPSF